MLAIRNVDKLITAEVKKGTGRDKVRIRKLQIEHKTLTASLANLHEDDGTPKDKNDQSGHELKKEDTKKKEEKQEAFEKAEAEKNKPKETKKPKEPSAGVLPKSS